MKNSIILILFAIFSTLFINNCVDEVVVNGPNNQGKLVIVSDPPGAQIYFMGTNTNKVTPDSILNLESGSYEVTLKKEDCCDTTFNVKVYDRLTTSINAKLVKQKAYGNLYIESVPDSAEIFLAGLNIHKLTPDTLVGIDTGSCQVTLKKDKYLDSTFNVNIFKDSTTSISVQLTQKPPGKGNIFIESVPNGAGIYLSGEDTKKVTPDSILNLTEGDYLISLTKANYSDTSFYVKVKEGISVSKIITLTSTNTTGSIFLQSIPNGAQIFISGVNTNKITPQGIVNLEEGDYEFTLKYPGYIDTTFKVTILKNQRIDKTIILKKASESGSILLESSPAGAQIFLEGANTNKVTPATIQNLNEGRYQFTLKLNGYKDTTFSANIVKNQQVDTNITLTRQINTGSLFLQSTPVGAHIFVEGLNTNKITPSNIDSLEEGSHTITLKLTGYKDTTFNITIIKNQLQNKNITLTQQLNFGSIILQSIPGGAQIFLDGINTSKTTPSTIENVGEGLHQFTLKLNGYNDTTFTVTIIKDHLISKSITLTEEITTGSILLQSTPSGAQIFLDGSNTNRATPSTIQDIEEGSHQITLKLSSYNDTTFNVTIFRNKLITRSIILTKEITTGSILLQSTPAGAQIILDGTNTDKVTPVTIQDLQEGSHQFTLKLNGYYDTTFNATIIRKQQISKNITLKEITTGSVLIQSDPGGAQIFLSGNNTEKLTPATFQNFEEGSYQFTLKLSGYIDTTFYVTIIRNQQVTKNVTLTKEITTGSLSVSSVPAGADIYLNNNSTGKTTPSTLYEIPEGNYSLTLKLVYYRDTTVNVQITRKQLTSKNIILTEASPVEIDQISTRLYFQQIRFSFSFNQDILLDKVEVFEPNNAGNQTFNYSNQEIKKSTNTYIYYPKTTRGTWKLIFYGTKAKDSQTDFIIQVEEDVR